MQLTSLLLLPLLGALVSAGEYEESYRRMSREVSSKTTLWKAGYNKYFRGMRLRDMRALLGTFTTNLPKAPVKEYPENPKTPIPTSFDARDQWPSCSSISHIRDQANCGSCWAVAAAEVASDRTCIKSNGQQQTYISEEDLLSCCGFCGYGCQGGYPIDAMEYWQYYGIVTGGDYASNQGCQPYEIQPCSGANSHSCFGSASTPSCSNNCESGYPVSYNDDKHYASSYYYVSSSVRSIQQEIMANGPVEVAFSVYEDFYHYESGVYYHTSGSYEGGHAVKFIGWGVENGVDYWLVANSWNSEWGEQGYFKIRRGTNECGIESQIVAGIAST